MRCGGDCNGGGASSDGASDWRTVFSPFPSLSLIPLAPLAARATGGLGGRMLPPPALFVKVGWLRVGWLAGQRPCRGVGSGRVTPRTGMSVTPRTGPAPSFCPQPLTNNVSERVWRRATAVGLLIVTFSAAQLRIQTICTRAASCSLTQAARLSLPEPIQNHEPRCWHRQAPVGVV